MQSSSEARDQLLDAASLVLARSGYAGSLLDDAGHLAGLYPQDVRQHFAGKEDLFLSVLDRIAEDWLEYMRALAQTARPAPARLHQILVLRILFRYDRLQPISGAFAEMISAVRPAYLSRSLGHFEREAQLLQSVIEEGLQARTLARIAEPAATARTLVLATNSLLPHCLRQRDWNDRAAVQQNGTALARLLVRSIVRFRKVKD